MISRGDAEVYAKHAEELVRFATVLVGPGAAEDVVADAVTRAFRSRGWATVANHRAYLFRATLNQARQARRTDWRRAQRERCFATGAVVDDHGLHVEVVDAMRRLSTRQRAVVFFTYWHDLPCHEVAELLATSSRTVERELTAARRKLEVLLHD